MKKLLAYFLGCMLILVGCKKVSDSASTNSSGYLEGQIRDYIAGKIIKSTPGSTIRLNETLSKIDFNTIERKKFSTNEDILIVSTKDIDVHDFTNLTKPGEIKVKTDGKETSTSTSSNNGAVTKAVFYIQDNKIVDGNIIEISSKTYKNNDIENNFTDIILARKKDFTGHLSVNYLSQKLSNDWEYKNGSVVSSTVIKAGANPSNVTNTVSVTSCQAWYLHTDYYIIVDNETFVYNSTDVFIGTTGCGSENQGFEPPSETGGGGETPPDTTCAQSKRLANDAVFVSNIQELKDSTGLNYEIGYTMIKNPAGGYTYSKVRGSANTSSISIPNTDMDGFIHNHHSGDLLTFSPVDIQFMYLLLKTGHMPNPSEFTMGVVTPTGKIQLFRILDVASFLNFGDTYLGFSQFSSWEASVAGSVTSSDYLANTIGLLNAISSSGLTLYEGDTNNLTNGFQKLTTNGSNTLTKSKCSN